MCCVKQEREITSEEDIRNSITDIILRQKTACRKENALTSILEHLKDAAVEVEKDNVLRPLDDDLDILKRNGEVSCWNSVHKSSGIN